MVSKPSRFGRIRGSAYQVHVMSVAEPTVVREAALAAKLAVVSKGAINVAALLPGCATNGARLMLQYKNLARAEALAVVIVTVFGSETLACKVVAVTALARFFGATKETLLRARVRARQRSVKSLVVDIENDTATLHRFLGCNVDVLRASRLADSGP
jgi:hypothetical protein